MMMVFSQFGKFTFSGPAIAISLAVALLVCLTLAPALLATPIGRQVTANKQRRQPAGFGSGRPRRPHPRPAWLGAGGQLSRSRTPLAWYGIDAPVTYDIFSELPPDAASKRGTQLLLQHLPPGEIGPLTVLARLPGQDFASDEGRLKIAELSKRLHDLPGVDKVRSLYRPTGAGPGRGEPILAQRADVARRRRQPARGGNLCLQSHRRRSHATHRRAR